MCGRVVCKWVGSRREEEDRSYRIGRGEGRSTHTDNHWPAKSPKGGTFLELCGRSKCACLGYLSPLALCVAKAQRAGPRGLQQARREQKMQVARISRTYLDGRCLLLQPRSCSLACVPVNGGLCGAKVSVLWLRVDMTQQKTSSPSTYSSYKERRARHAHTQK